MLVNYLLKTKLPITTLSVLLIWQLSLLLYEKGFLT